MMIASCERSCPCWRTKCGRMKTCIPQSDFSQPVEIGGWYLTAKCSPLPESGIVNHDVENIRSSIRGFDQRDLSRCRIFISLTDFCIKRWLRFGQNILSEKCCC